MTGQPHLADRLALVEARVHRLVEHRRSGDPGFDDPFRGLYLSDADVDRLLAPVAAPPGPDVAALQDVEAAESAREAAGRPSRLRSLQRAGNLTDLDVDLLLTALAPDLDVRMERLYGWLNDDVTRRRASVDLAFAVAGVPSSLAAARARVASGGSLRVRRLLTVEDQDRPFLTRALRVPDRVAAHLLGDDRTDPDLVDVLAPAEPWACPRAVEVAGRLTAGADLVYVRDLTGVIGTAVAAAALGLAGRPAVVVDLARLAARPERDDLLDLAGREALLRGGAVVAGPVDALADLSVESVRRLADLPGTVLVTGASTWDPRWSRRVPLLVTAPVLEPAERAVMWRERLSRRGLGPLGEAAPWSAGEGVEVPAHLHLGPEQISRAVTAARLTAGSPGAAVTAADLASGARSQNAAGLERLTHRIEPEVGWDDLVLTPSVLGELHELAGRARHRDQVLGSWRMRPGGGRGRGVTALFAGDSGTGKTMSAEVIASELGLDLYRVDLATVVDKYVGETEKNLERIFAEAAGVNAVLLFDEADAVFGKRSEVRDAHDRYANVESAFLLQRLETFDGLAVLSTNLRANIDEAFTRRFDAIIDFPSPDEQMRLALWRRCLAPPLPVGDDVDIGFCARAFELTGGNIRSVAVTAAYLAAETGTPLSMVQVVAAVRQEYRKLGRLVLQQEFGAYLADAVR